MKKGMLVCTLLFSIILVISIACQSGNPANTDKLSVRITCTINDAGAGWLRSCRLCPAPDLHVDRGARMKNLRINIIGNNLLMHFIDTLIAEPVFELDEPVVIADSITTRLGFQNVTIEPGSYKVEKEGRGSLVKLDIEAN